MQPKKLIFIVPLAWALVGCGGSSDSDTPPPSDPAASSETGVFVDSPVANIDYRTDTLEGVTNENGEYDYEPGETVTFSIGDLEFAPVAASGILTPLDIAATTDTSNNKVINMIRLLQTLDTDGDPSNGINISDTAKGSATQVDFDLPEADFAESAAVTNLITNGGQDTPPEELVSSADAKTHLEASLTEEEVSFTNEDSLTGGWVLDTDNFIFMAFDEARGEYLHVEVADTLGDEEGLEYGAFNLDETGVFTVTDIFFNGNGSIGVYPADGATFTFTPNGENLAFHILEESEEEEDLTGTRVTSSGLVGTWVHEIPPDGDEEEVERLVLAFLEDGTYVHAEIDVKLDGEIDDDNGAEVGSYSRDNNSGVLTISDIILDTNNSTGLSDFVGTADLSVSFSGNTMTLTVNEEGGAEELIFNRL